MQWSTSMNLIGLLLISVVRHKKILSSGNSLGRGHLTLVAEGVLQLLLEPWLDLSAQCLRGHQVIKAINSTVVVSYFNKKRGGVSPTCWSCVFKFRIWFFWARYIPGSISVIADNLGSIRPST